MFFDSQLGQEKNAILGVIPNCFRDDGELLFENDLRLVGDGAVLPLRAWICPEVDVVDPVTKCSAHVDPCGAAHWKVTACCFFGYAHLKHRLIKLVALFDVLVSQLLEQVDLFVGQIIN